MRTHHGKDAAKPSGKMISRKTGARKSMREMDQHDRKEKRRGSKAYKNLEGKSL